MDTVIYGVDTSKEVTPEMVKKAIINCFYEAHCNQTGFIAGSKSDEYTTRNYCTQIIKKGFEETKGDFNKPSRESILNMLPWLAQFSVSFRDQETIKKHMEEITKLVNLI